MGKVSITTIVRESVPINRSSKCARRRIGSGSELIKVKKRITTQTELLT